MLKALPDTRLLLWREGVTFIQPRISIEPFDDEFKYVLTKRGGPFKKG